MSFKNHTTLWCLVPLLWPCLAAQESTLRQAARLDAEHKCGEAERLYQQALTQASASIALLNNVGNHYLICGDADKAQAYFGRVVKANPAHANANLQLARIANDRHQGALALGYLARVSDSQPATRMLRAEAMHWAGKDAAALAMLDGVQKDAEADPRLHYLYGITCARVGAYDRAVTAFTSVLVAHPDDVEVLFNLGRAAARAKLYDRARRALEVTTKLQPGNVDAWMELAGVSAAEGDYARAVYLLVQAKQLAPGRPEISLALAHAAQSGEYYGDAALAYDEYLRLKPGDDEVRRDRALALGFTDKRQAEGLKEIRWYTHKHPEDPVGYFDLAQLTWRDDPAAALEALTTAIRLDPKYVAARVDLAWLLNRQGRTAEAVPHLQKAIEINPKDVRALDQLGAAYSSLDRPADAEKILRRAAAVAPADRDVMMHLGRALMELGHEEEATQFLNKFQQSHPARVRGRWTQPAMIESAGLPAGERGKRAIERLRKEADAHQDDPELQFRLSSLLLAEGQVDSAEAEFRKLLTRNAETQIWQRAGSFLLSFERYPLAREFLERAAAGNPSANLDLATALFYLDGPTKALTILERVPVQQRSGDYLLLEAKLLDAADQRGEADKVLKQGLQLSSSNPQIAKEAALLLVRHDQSGLAIQFLEKAGAGNPDLLLLRATISAVAGQRSAAEKALREIEAEWPEWERPYMVHGLLLEKTQPGVARQKIQTAIALGSTEASAHCALARLGSGPSSDPKCACAGGLNDLLFPRCARP